MEQMLFMAYYNCKIKSIVSFFNYRLNGFLEKRLSVPRPHMGRTNKRTVRRVNMTHHATFRINRSNYCRDMAVCPFFKMAPVRHVRFLKFRNCYCHTLRSVNVRYPAKLLADRSSRWRDMAVYSIRCGDMAVFVFLKMAAVRHLGFLKSWKF